MNAVFWVGKDQFIASGSQTTEQLLSTGPDGGRDLDKAGWHLVAADECIRVWRAPDCSVSFVEVEVCKTTGWRANFFISAENETPFFLVQLPVLQRQAAIKTLVTEVQSLRRSLTTHVVHKKKMKPIKPINPGPLR